ncbi:hypothetical protein EF908_17075, partial [Streptomyces sp. WAC04770]
GSEMCIRDSPGPAHPSPYALPAPPAPARPSPYAPLAPSAPARPSPLAPLASSVSFAVLAAVTTSHLISAQRA